MYEVIVTLVDGSEKKVFESWSNSECYREMYFFEAHPYPEDQSVRVRPVADSNILKQKGGIKNG